METTSTLARGGVVPVHPSLRTRSLRPRSSGRVGLWRPATTVRAPSSMACRESPSGTTAVPTSRRRATTTAGWPAPPPPPPPTTTTDPSHPPPGAQAPGAPMPPVPSPSAPSAPMASSRTTGTKSTCPTPPGPPAASPAGAATAPPLRRSRGVRAAGGQCVGGGFSLRRKPGPDGTSMTPPFTQGMGETHLNFV